MHRVCWLLALASCGGGASATLDASPIVEIDAAAPDAPTHQDAPILDAPQPDAALPDARPAPDAPPPDAAITYGDPIEADQIFHSPDGKVTVKALAGTRLPLAGVTVQIIESAQLPDGLRTLDPTFGVRFTPDGAAFSPPLELVLDSGAAAPLANGFAEVDRWDVLSADFLVPLDLAVRRTAADREIVSAKISSLRDLAFVQGGPILGARIDEPAHPIHRLAATLGAALTVRNASAVLSATAARGVTSGGAPLETLATTPATSAFQPGQQDMASVGSFRCAALGTTSLAFAATARDFKEGATPRTVAPHTVERAVAVTCVDISGTFAETLDGSSTVFTARVFIDDGQTKRDATAEAGVSFAWVLTASCGALADVPGAGRKAYAHGGCADEVSTQATIALTVTVAVAGLEPVQIGITQFARSGEEQPAVVFR